MRHFSYNSEQHLTSIDRYNVEEEGTTYFTNKPNQNQSQSQNPVLDFAHKRQEKALEYQQAGRVVREGEHHLRYDANGRMVEKTRHQNGFRPQTTQYEWDETDRLIRVQLPNGEAWCYQYDVLGRRCRKYRQYPSEANYQSHKPRDIHYLWQGDQLSQQQSHYADGRIVTTQWVYEPGSFP